jgi:uncharacterized phage-like protein YoqJ
MILGTSGHRSLGEASFPKSSFNAIYDKTKSIIQELKPSRILTGFAIGYDLMVADLCVEMQIPFIACLPFNGQEAYWSVYDRKHYNDLLAKADKIEVINRGSFASWKYQARNVWIVDNSDKMLVCYSGVASGTKNCYDYAVKKNKEIIRINPLDYRK